MKFNKFVSYSLLAHLIFFLVFIILPSNNTRKNAGFSVLFAGDRKDMEVLLEDAIENPNSSGAFGEALTASMETQAPEASAVSVPDPSINEIGKSNALEALPQAQKFRMPPGMGFSTADRNALIDPHGFEKSTLANGGAGLLLAYDNGFQDFAYLKDLADAIQRLWKWPAEAALRGKNGDLYIRLRVGRTGALERLEIIKSSGNQYLDQAVLEAIKGEFPYKPLPDGWLKNSLTLTGHFIYQKN